MELAQRHARHQLQLHASERASLGDFYAVAAEVFDSLADPRALAQAQALVARAAF